MPRRVLLTVVASLTLLGTSTAAATVAAEPTLSVVGQRPLALRGSGFKSRELVRVTVAANTSRAVKRVRAGSRGGFSVTLPNFVYKPCGALLVARGVGANGSTATLRVLVRECPPPPG